MANLVPLRSASGARELVENSWIGRTWGIIFVILSSMGVLCTSVVLVYVISKMVDGTLRRNQSLGILLLLTLICLYATTLAFVYNDVTDAVCTVRFLSHTIAYALCFGTLLAKAIHLKCISGLGDGGRVYVTNQLLTLTFVVGVQVALSVQWVFLRGIPTYSYRQYQAAPATTVTDCAMSVDDFLLNHAYLAFLLLLITGYSVSIHKSRQNHRESQWLLTTTLTCSLAWLAWMLLYKFVAVTREQRDLVVCIELLLCSTLTLIFIFVPKIHRLLVFRRAEDEKERLSPFFHDSGDGSGSSGSSRYHPHHLQVPYSSDFASGSPDYIIAKHSHVLPISTPDKSWAAYRAAAMADAYPYMPGRYTKLGTIGRGEPPTAATHLSYFPQVKLRPPKTPSPMTDPPEYRTQTPTPVGLPPTYRARSRSVESSGVGGGVSHHPLSTPHHSPPHHSSIYSTAAASDFKPMFYFGAESFS